MPPEDEIIRIILAASLSLTSMLTVLIGFLLTQYSILKAGPKSVWGPYKSLAKVMVCILIASGFTSVLSLLYLTHVLIEPYLLPLYRFIISLFVSVTIALMIGIVLVVRRVWE